MEEMFSSVKLLWQDLGHVAWPKELLDPVWIIWIVLTVIIGVYWLFCGVNHKDRAQKFEKHAWRMREKVIVLTEERKELCEALIESKDRIESLEKKNSEQDEQIKAASKAKAVVDNENATLKEECTKKSTDLAERETDFEKIKGELDEQLRLMSVEKEQIEKHHKEQLERLEKEEDQMKEELEMLSTEKRQINSKVEKLIAEKDEVSSENKKLNEQIGSVASLEEEIVAKDRELKALQDCTFLMMRTTSDEPMENELEDIKDAAKIEQLKEQIAEFEEKLEEEEAKRQEMNDTIKNMKEETEKVKESEIKAQQFGEDSLKKLQILSDYFSEQEQELIQNVEELDEAKIEASVKFTLESEKTTLLEKQLESYRVQVAELKKEIVDSDKQARKMVHKVEQRAHDNWLAARRAEEELRDVLDRRRFHGPPPPPFGPPPMGHRPNFSPRGPKHSFERGDNLFHQPPTPRSMMHPKNLPPHPQDLSNSRSATSSPRSLDMPQPGSPAYSPISLDMPQPKFVPLSPSSFGIPQPKPVISSPSSLGMPHSGFATALPRPVDMPLPRSVPSPSRSHDMQEPRSSSTSPRSLDMPQPKLATSPRRVLEIPPTTSTTSKPKSEKNQQAPSMLDQSQENVQQNYYIPTPQPDEIKPFPVGVNVTPLATETPRDDFFISIV